MHAEGLSLRQVAALFNIRNREMIMLWQRAYDMGGAPALHPHAGVGILTMEENADAVTKAGDTDDTGRSRKELVDELRQLRMENAYLKKLKALAQGDEPARDTEP
jgi:transposase